MDRKRRKTPTVCLTRRRAFNRINFIFTCCVLALAVQLASSNFTARINKISDDLHKALGNAFELEGPNFTEIHGNVTYNKIDPFNPKGMGGLYNITTMFMNVLVSKEIYPEGFIKVENGQLVLGSFSEQWKTLLAHYAVLIAVVIVLLIFGILMPICGMCFCCCRCCGKCGARSKPFDKKGDLCRKICLASLLIIFGTLMLFGVVCSFVSNQQMQEGTNELSGNLKEAIQDADGFVKATQNEINTLFDTNYKEFEGLLFVTLDTCSGIVLDQLGEYSNATALTEAVNIVNGLQNVKENLTFMKFTTNKLRQQADDLKAGLNQVRANLFNTLRECEGFPPCKEFLSKYVNNITLEIDYSQLPDIGPELEELSSLLDSGIIETVQEGQRAFENIQYEINRTISDEIPKVKNAVRQAGDQITLGSSNVTSTLGKVDDVLHDVLEPLNDMDDYLKTYSPYRYYLGLGVSCVLLLVTLCITLGLICGVCGKRPDAYSDDCCNKGAGSRFLMIGVALMFLFALVFVVVTIVHFFVGILSQRLVCDSFRESNESQVVKLMDEYLNLKENFGLDVNISGVLYSCNQNLSAYYVFHLQSQIDLDDVAGYIDKFEINKTIGELIGEINANTKIDILTEEAKYNLQQLAESKFGHINYDKFIDELNGNLTSADLNFLAGKLDEIAMSLPDQFPNKTNLIKQINKSSKHLRRLQQDYVGPMKEEAKQSLEVVQNLQHSLNFGKVSFEQAITDLIVELESAENYLRVNGTKAMTEIALDFGTGVEAQVRTYLYRVINNTRDNVGKCGPLSSALNSTLIATCDKILLPWNGFWFSLMWCLLLFIPTIILSVKLATLYQKYEPYPGPLVEANVNDKRSKMKNKKKNKRYERGSYGPDAGNEHGIPREMPGGSHYPDTRYADMAPKFPVVKLIKQRY